VPVQSKDISRNIEIIEPPLRPLLSLAAVGKASRYILAVAVFVLLWVALLDFSKQVAGPGLDPSYAQAFGYFLRHDFQAGKDYIFTYGPLGYFLHTAYDPALYWYKYAWEMSVKFIFVWVLFRVLQNYAALSTRLLFSAVVLAFAPYLLRMHDSLYLFLIFAGGMLALNAAKLSPPLILFVAVILAVLALAKFTYLILGASVIGLLTIHLLARKPRLWALLPGGAFAMIYLGLWRALGQSLANLPQYVSTSLQIAWGYVEAMALEGNRSEVYLALAIVVMLGAAVLGYPTRQRLAVRNCAMVALFGIALFLQWKHGFVRHHAHALSFFNFALLTSLTLPALFAGIHDWTRPVQVILISYCALFSAAGIFSSTRDNQDPGQLLVHMRQQLREKVRAMIRPRRLKDRLERDKAAMEVQYALPKMKAYIKDAPVDLISYEQGVLLLNRFNWHPRPIFQSYSAYTPCLLAANARFFQQERAPKFVIVHLQPIDGRLGAMEDGQALCEILRHYQPVLAEKSYLLFERSTVASAPAPPASIVRQQRVHFNEEICIKNLPDAVQRLSIDLHYTLEGKVRKLLYKPPSAFIAVRTADNQCFTHRLVPAVARDGFLINPLLEDNTDLVNLYGPARGKRVVSFSILADAHTRRSFEKEISITIWRAPEAVGRKLEPMALNRVLYPMLESVPCAVQSQAGVETRRCDAEEVVMVHADGEMIFPVSAGSHQVVGRFGILPEACEQGRTDGVQFEAEFVPAKGAPALLFARHLDPARHERDRGMQSLNVQGVFPCAGVVRLKTGNRPGANTAWDWSYWTAVQIKSLPEKGSDPK
jgi:hypothetical protein